MKAAVILFFACLSWLFPALAEKPPLRIGLIASLSGFSARYGTAVLEGARLAAKEIKERGTRIELLVEDDQSSPSQVTSAWQKLSSIDRAEGLIAGTWWANSIAPQASRAGVPLLSCETLYNREWIATQGYFTLLGDLRDWIRVYEPLVAERGWKKGAMVKFTSGFADTLEEEMRQVFSSQGRSWIKSIEYSDLDLKEAATIAAQLKVLKPDVVYVDAQPQSFAALMKRMTEQKISGMAVISNPIVRDAAEEKLFDPRAFQGEIYYTQRESFRPAFVEKFRAHYGRDPLLNADLGYYALHLLVQALSGQEPAGSALKSGKLSVDQLHFEFDDLNVYRGVRQKVIRLGGPPAI